MQMRKTSPRNYRLSRIASVEKSNWNKNPQIYFLEKLEAYGLKVDYIAYHQRVFKETYHQDEINYLHINFKDKGKTNRVCICEGASRQVYSYFEGQKPREEFQNKIAMIGFEEFEKYYKENKKFFFNDLKEVQGINHRKVKLCYDVQPLSYGTVYYNWDNKKLTLMEPSSAYEKPLNSWGNEKDFIFCFSSGVYKSGFNSVIGIDCSREIQPGSINLMKPTSYVEHLYFSNFDTIHKFKDIVLEQLPTKESPLVKLYISLDKEGNLVLTKGESRIIGRDHTLQTWVPTESTYEKAIPVYLEFVIN